MKLTKLSKIILLIVILMCIMVCFSACKNSDDNSSDNGEKISIQYYANNELVLSSQYKVGDLIEKPDITLDNGDEIISWKNGKTLIFFPFVAEEDLQLTAIIKKTIKVTFIVDNTPYVTSNYGNSDYVMAPEKPVQYGYKFIQWMYNDEFVSFPFDMSNVKDATSITFIAKFEPLYDVKYYVDNSLYKTIQLTNLDTLTTPQSPNVEGRDFIMWVDQNGIPLDHKTPIDKNLEYHAVFEYNYHKVNYYIGSYLYKTIYVEDYAINIDYPNAQFFYGWYKSKAFTQANKYDFSTKLTSDLNLYGKTVNTDYEVLQTKGNSCSIPIDPTTFSRKINFVSNYSNKINLTIKNGNVNAIYSFECSGNKSALVKYDMFNGEIIGIHGSNDSKVKVFVSPYDYLSDEFSYVVKDENNYGYYKEALEELCVVIAQECIKYIHNLYSDYVSNYDENVTYDTYNEPIINATIKYENNKICVDTDVNYENIKIKYYGLLQGYSQNNSSYQLYVVEKGTYSIEITYIFELNGQKIRVYKTFTLSI